MGIAWQARDHFAEDVPPFRVAPKSRRHGGRKLEHLATESSSMAALRGLCLRHLKTSRLPAVSTQRRWAQVHDVRFLATHGTQERILGKYKDKLDRKAKA